MTVGRVQITFGTLLFACITNVISDILIEAVRTVEETRTIIVQ